MSYILEALKKAEAERRLGATPTLHAGALEGAATPAGAAARRPLVAVVAVMALVIAGLAAVVWRQADDRAAPVAATPVAVAPVAVAAPAQAPLAVAAPAPAPIVAQRAPDPVPAPKPAVVAAPAVAPPVVAPAVTPEPKPAREPDDGAIQALRDLPEPIRRAIPAYSMDGYMYSPNPADRLVLIDKVLRREGEEVAPGLVLEKLLPKGAVFTFRGYRYRVTF